MAVAFASRRGFAMLSDAVSSLLANDGTFELLVGLDMMVTEPEFLEEMLDLSEREPRASMYCLVSESAAIYHPKLYITRQASAVSIVAGSSNLTEGGLRRNAEVNVIIDTTDRDEVVSDAYAAYARLKFLPSRVIPDTELLSLYRAAFSERRKGRQNRSAAAGALEKKAQSLKPPPVGERDLVGWLRAVYDLLPAGEFRNSDLYASESNLHQVFPGNRNIRAKIRQQLQVLRDMGLVDHRGRGLWARTRVKSRRHA
jgi:HKD family nuclease